MHEILGMAFIIVGLAFDVFGCVGVFLTLGWTAAGMKSLLCIVFLLITSPVTAHALARAAHKSGIRLWEGSVVDKYEEDAT